MRKFKVGDKVIATSEFTGIHEGIVMEVDPSDAWHYYVKLGSGLWGFSEFELVLIDA